MLVHKEGVNLTRRYTNSLCDIDIEVFANCNAKVGYLGSSSNVRPIVCVQCAFDL